MGILATTADERVANIGITDELLSVQLRDGRIISVPLTWYPRLQQATKKQRDNWEVSGDGYEIHWPDIDEDLSTEGLLLGIPAVKSTLPIRRQHVDSEAIASIGYNKDTRMLEIEFRFGRSLSILGSAGRRVSQFHDSRIDGDIPESRLQESGLQIPQNPIANCIVCDNSQIWSPMGSSFLVAKTVNHATCI